MRIRILQSHDQLNKNTMPRVTNAILAAALTTGAALVAPRLRVKAPTALAARGRLLDELADLDGEAPVAQSATARMACFAGMLVFFCCADFATAKFYAYELYRCQYRY